MTFLHDFWPADATVPRASAPAAVEASPTVDPHPERGATAPEGAAGAEGTGTIPKLRSARAAIMDDQEVRFSKTQLVLVRHKSNPHKVITCCALVDEQSRDTFADEQLATDVAVNPVSCEYNLETLAGLTKRV